MGCCVRPCRISAARPLETPTLQRHAIVERKPAAPLQNYARPRQLAAVWRNSPTCVQDNSQDFCLLFLICSFDVLSYRRPTRTEGVLMRRMRTGRDAAPAGSA
jgi:hypothetical protein